MAKRKTKKRFLRPIHIIAILVIVGYSVVAKVLYFRALTRSDIVTTFVVPLIYGIGASMIFLYLFSHDDFFHFVKEIEKREDKKERAYIKKFLHFGKIAASIIIGIVGGPIFLALTIRLLLNRFTHKYFLIFGTMLISLFVSVGLVRKLISFFI